MAGRGVALATSRLKRRARSRTALVSTAPRSAAHAFGRADPRVRPGPRSRGTPGLPGSRVPKASPRDHRRVRALAQTGAIDRGDETPRALARGYRPGNRLLRPGPLQPDVPLRRGPVSGRLPSGDLSY